MLCQFLQHRISLTGNLRTLRLRLHTRGTPLDVVYVEEQDRIAEPIQLARMAKQKCLKFMKIEKVPSTAFRKLLQAIVHIEKPQVSVSDVSPARYDIYFHRVMLNNLQEGCIHMHSKKDIEQLGSSLAGRTWPAKTLRINTFTLVNIF